MVSHNSFLKEAMNRSGVIQELENLEDEFSIYEELIKAWIEAGKTQEDIAKSMHTSISAIGRLEPLLRD